MSYDYLARSSQGGNQQGVFQAKTRVFEERYSGGVLDMNIFCFALIFDNEVTSGVPTPEGSINSKRLESSNHQQLHVTGPKTEGNIESGVSMVDEEELVNDGRDNSHSGTGSSSSMKDSSASMAEFRNFHSFTEQQTPKTLILILRLIMGLYLIMLTVASVNLGINVQRQIESENDVHTVRYAYDRMNWISMNQLLFRVLLNTANGYEPNSTTLIPDRFNTYVKYQKTRIQ